MEKINLTYMELANIFSVTIKKNNQDLLIANPILNTLLQKTFPICFQYALIDLFTKLEIEMNNLEFCKTQLEPNDQKAFIKLVGKPINNSNLFKINFDPTLWDADCDLITGKEMQFLYPFIILV